MYSCRQASTPKFRIAPHQHASLDTLAVFFGDPFDGDTSSSGIFSISIRRKSNSSFSFTTCFLYHKIYS